MRVAKVVLAGGLMMLAGAASAQQAQPTPTTAVRKSDRSDPGRIVCRNDDATGSRLKKTRTCRTAAEWKAALNATDRRDVERAQATRWRAV